MNLHISPTFLAMTVKTSVFKAPKKKDTKLGVLFKFLKESLGYGRLDLIGIDQLCVWNLPYMNCIPMKEIIQIRFKSFSFIWMA